MRRIGSVVPIVLTLAVFALDAAAQQPGSAGATRPKLVVLKALPDSQLFPLMNLMAASLGVQCDFCHVQESPDLARSPSNVGGWRWDRDDKPQKRRAREMMQMVADLNARSFAGAPRVTCYTCHRGSPQPSRTVPLPPPPAPAGARTATAPPLPSADQVWERYRAAVGPVDPEVAGRATIISGWDARPEGRYARVEVVVAGADRYRATMTMADGTTSLQGFDGESGWVASNAGVQTLSSGDLQRLKRIAARYVELKERPADLRVTGLARVGERDAYVATSRIDPTTTRTLYFDTATGLLVREMTTTETLLLPLQEQVDYDEYRPVDGVLMPYRTESSDGAPYDTVERTFLQIRRNVPIDAAMFRPPSSSPSPPTPR